MSDLKLSIPHKLSAEEALARIKNLLNDLKNDHQDMVEQVNEDWNGNAGRFSFSVKGFSLSGSIAVSDSAVDIDAKLPFAVSLFKGKISQVITDKAKQLLA